MNIWKGMFSPTRNTLQKHRDYCGKIENHIGITSMDPIENLDDVEPKHDVDELVRVNEGGGSSPYLVGMGWIDHSGTAPDTDYEYIVFVSPPPLDDEDYTTKLEDAVVKEIAEYIEEENARRRAAGESEIVDEG